MHWDLYIFSKDIKVEIAIKNCPMGYYYVQPSFPICKNLSVSYQMSNTLSTAVNRC